MRIQDFIFSGFINFDYDDNFRTIKLKDGDKSVDLVKKLRAIFDLFESEVSISYFISEDKKTEDEMLENWVLDIFGGITAEYKTDSYCYSSYTYGTDYDTFLKIGEHDLFNEFSEYEGKYCLLKIKVKRK